MLIKYSKNENQFSPDFVVNSKIFCRFKSKNFRYVIYTGDRDAKPVDFLQKANDRFNVFVDERNLEFIFLK